MQEEKKRQNNRHKKASPQHSEKVLTRVVESCNAGNAERTRIGGERIEVAG
jgi:hypothetical protein